MTPADDTDPLESCQFSADIASCLLLMETFPAGRRPRRALSPLLMVPYMALLLYSLICETSTPIPFQVRFGVASSVFVFPRRSLIPLCFHAERHTSRMSIPKEALGLALAIFLTPPSSTLPIPTSRILHLCQ
ncbi:hypothetical protein BDN70DRAFT_669191 [Pholiota conissans]|uniref:Uncharacterized protein n=1 Tax=Pholiota conissans TaxID=109636 RepID=A0A9P6D0W9_9AGAR|nr:hypothetical protein BDN70DRAFT_669191 [Pholiota conissans]